jgi:uncharacterized DUF497 family protein
VISGSRSGEFTLLGRGINPPLRRVAERTRRPGGGDIASELGPSFGREFRDRSFSPNWGTSGGRPIGTFCPLCGFSPADFFPLAPLPRRLAAAPNLRKHGASFELASTVFSDPRLLTVADLEHSETAERWFSVGCASNGAMLSIVYLWSESDPAVTKIRLISAREATPTEIRQYEENP